MLRRAGWAIVGLSWMMIPIFSGVSSAAEQKYSCNGQIIQGMTDKAAESKKPQTISLNVSLNNGKMAITIGSKTLAAQVTSDDKIQLKFKTKEFVGEYFHYTGDLFFIYKAGKLARLTCSRS